MQYKIRDWKKEGVVEVRMERGRTVERRVEIPMEGGLVRPEDVSHEEHVKVEVAFRKSIKAEEAGWLKELEEKVRSMRVKKGELEDACVVLGIEVTGKEKRMELMKLVKERIKEDV